MSSNLLGNGAIAPANQLDAVLSEYFRRGDANGLESLGIAQGTYDALRAAIALTASPAEQFGLAQFLGNSGLLATALAAINRALPALPIDGPLTATFVDLRAAVIAQAGMTWAASADRRLGMRLRDQIDRGEELPVREHERFFIVDAWNQPVRFLDLSAQHMANALVNDPVRDPFLAKRIHHSGALKQFLGASVDFSFFVLDQDEAPVLQVECDTHHLSPLRCREAPVTMEALTPSIDALRAAVPFALGQLQMIASWAGTGGIQIELAPQTEVCRVLTPLVSRLNPVIKRMVRGAATLLRSPDDIVASYSANHRRSLRKATRYIHIIRFASGDPLALEYYSMLHAKISRTPAVSQSLLTELLNNGQYILYVGLRDSIPVGLVVISRHGNTAYYSAGITASPDKVPIGHALMHRAIMDACGDGLARFDFGLLEIDQNGDPKMKSIARFKLGFCDDVHERLIAHLQV